MKHQTQLSTDKYRVEATSARDLDGCAATEATGLIPSLPKSDAQMDSYKQLMPFSPDCYVEKVFPPKKEKTP